MVRRKTNNQTNDKCPRKVSKLWKAYPRWVPPSVDVIKLVIGLSILEQPYTQTSNFFCSNEIFWRLFFQSQRRRQRWSRLRNMRKESKGRRSEPLHLLKPKKIRFSHSDTTTKATMTDGLLWKSFNELAEPQNEPPSATCLVWLVRSPRDGADNFCRLWTQRRQKCTIGLLSRRMFKGSVSRDFRPPVFFMIRTHLGPW